MELVKAQIVDKSEFTYILVEYKVAGVITEIKDYWVYVDISYAPEIAHLPIETFSGTICLRQEYAESLLEHTCKVGELIYVPYEFTLENNEYNRALVSFAFKRLKYQKK